MIKIIKNPKLDWMKNTELYGRKYIFMTDYLPGKHAYSTICFKALIGYIIMKIKYRNK